MVDRLFIAKVAKIEERYALWTNACLKHSVIFSRFDLVNIKNRSDTAPGIGGGRIPYDVNTALMPAALRSIAALSHAGFYPIHPHWSSLATRYARIWEDTTLAFFSVSLSASEAQSRLKEYISLSSFPGPSQISSVNSSSQGVQFHALALEGNNNLSQIQVMNTDDCFRHFLLNTTRQSQLTAFINQTATNIRRTFPAGLMTDIGMLVANPAFGGSSPSQAKIYAANWTTSAYHGTVVWSWPLAMMARGLELQLSRCDTKKKAPHFCKDECVYRTVLAAYNTLWDSIEANKQHLSTEVWSWVYKNGGFQFEQLGALPPADGGSQTGKLLSLLSFCHLVRDTLPCGIG